MYLVQIRKIQQTQVAPMKDQFIYVRSAGAAIDLKIGVHANGITA
jgi:hypothetical protein